MYLAHRAILAALLSTAFAGACIDRRTDGVVDVQTPDTTADDTSELPDSADSAHSGDDTTQLLDIVADAVVPDVASDISPDTSATLVELPCNCPEGQVYRHDACVPTLSLGCGAPCTNTCDEGFTCMDCAASSSCATRDCQAACGVTLAPHALVPEPLRLAPARIEIGESFAVQGTSFYIGALGHNVRIAGKLVETGLAWTSDCELTITPPALATGIHRVEVSQYNGGDPWVDAGFLHVAIAPTCAQPGLACAADGLPCCSDADSAWVCREGRCRRP